MIDPIKEELIPFSKLSSWCEKNLGNRVSPSSLHRWRLNGIRGVKLETILIGGRRYSSPQKICEFFQRATIAQDGPPRLSGPSCRFDQDSHQEADDYLENEGMA